MANSARVIAFLAVVLVLLPRIALGDFLSPLLSSVFDDVCKEVECGKGTCKPSSNSTFFYECECDLGWSRTSSESSDLDDHLKFLPCVVPNCTLSYSCAKAPSPVQEKARKANESIFDPCYWTNCGGGFCNKTSVFTYSCVCVEGYHNLLNVTAFPCFEECAIGMDCANLGIPLPNKSTAPAEAVADEGTSPATSILQGVSLWLMIMMIIGAMIP
ncbi:uncharacterized protein LOC122295143 [Carya illinoinensis]|uniref:Uncharacterized protein n=1 Tax=Carya illinoinensis TaxID=32201 RepID=A0A8T1RE32_CARIL|nr:uncharacterized protein LOC122295143 [Carya illinoinensis]KAG6664854.1 hypothetical protein CIPAW_02G121800 [Carya illinoinensis]